MEYSGLANVLYLENAVECHVIIAEFGDYAGVSNGAIKVPC